MASLSDASSWSSTSPIMNSWPMRCASVIEANVRWTQLSSGVGVGVGGAGVGVAGGGVAVGVGVGVGVGVSVGARVGLADADADAVAVAGAAAGAAENTQPATRKAMRSTGTIRE